MKTPTIPAVMTDYVVRLNNGFGFEYYVVITATSIKAARAEFLKQHAGAWYATPKGFKVSTK